MKNTSLFIYNKKTGHTDLNWQRITAEVHKANSYFNAFNPDKFEVKIITTAGIGGIHRLSPTITIDKGQLSAETIEHLNEMYEQMRQGSWMVPPELALELFIDLSIILEAELAVQQIQDMIQSIMQSAAVGLSPGGAFALGLLIALVSCAGCNACSKSCSKKDDPKPEQKKEERKCFPPMPWPDYLVNYFQALGFSDFTLLTPLDANVRLDLFTCANSLDYVGLSINNTRILLIRNAIL